MTLMTQEPTHISVLLKEVTELLVTDRSGTYLDATLGMGGHSTAILERLDPKGRVIGMDWDPEMLGLASRRLAPYAGRFEIVQSNFKDLAKALDNHNVTTLNGALFDLGISSYHYDAAPRGFSFQREDPLDMRLSPENELTASAIVNEWPVEQITLLLREYGEERLAYKIAKAIVARREQGPIKSTGELRTLIERCVPRVGKIHPATRTFQALRIAVNRELENLTRGVESAAGRMAKGGRLAVIAFHSLEDRIVKSLLSSFVQSGGWAPVTKGALTPSMEEIDSNPRSRSAKLRVVEKL
jgi:16S rRNA (cytosine1402-N4)-methyltransferase